MSRTAADTNVFIRLLIRDDEQQFQAAWAMAEQTRFYILLTVALETEWVLRSRMKVQRETISGFFTSLIKLGVVEFQEQHRVETALDFYVSGMDFADALHMTSLDAGDRMMTFDRDFIRLAADRRLNISVELVQ